MEKFKIEEKIVAMLKTVYDPEIPVNVCIKQQEEAQEKQAAAAIEAARPDSTSLFFQAAQGIQPGTKKKEHIRYPMQR